MKAGEWLLHGAARLPMWLLYGFSDVAAVVLHRLVRYRRGVVRENLRLSFPEKTEAQLRAIERDFYRHFADNAVESVKLLRMSPDEMRRRMVLKMWS